MEENTQIEPVNCINCGATVTTQYCGSCGQKRQGKISVQFVKSELLSGLFNYDSPGLKTLIDLTIRPANVFREYLNGARARYLGPIRYSFFVLAVFVAVAGLTDTSIVYVGDVSQYSENTQQLAQTYMALINTLIVPITLFTALLYAAVLRLFFLKREYTFIELYIPSLLSVVHVGWLATLLILFGVYQSSTSLLVYQLVHFIYFVWAIGGIYQPTKVVNYVKSSIAYVLTMLITLIITIVYGIVVGAFSALEKI